MKRALSLVLLIVAAASVEARPPARRGSFRLLSSTPSTVRIRAQAVKLADGQVLVSGGSTTSMSLDRFDPATEVFTAVANDAIERANHTATLLADGRVLIAGGVDLGASSAPTTDCRIFDPSTNSVSAAGSMATPRYDHTATLLADGRVLVAGGNNSATLNLASAEIYNPATNSWSAAGNLQNGRYGHAAALLGSGKVLIAGGTSNRLELYDPAANTFALGPNHLRILRLRATATRLTDGKVAIIGGFIVGDGGDAQTWVEIYDPATNTLSYGGQMAYKCGGHSAALLPDGRILVTGDALGVNGVTVWGSVEAQVYDPATLRGTAIRHLKKPRMWSPSVVLNDGRVLIVGGSNSDAWSNAELFDPALLGSTRGNVDLDLRGDILWKHTSNQTYWWDMNGFAGNSQTFFIGAGETVIPITGEFDGGGSTDLYVTSFAQGWGIRGYIEHETNPGLRQVRHQSSPAVYEMGFEPSQIVFRPRDMNGDGRDDPFTQDPGTGRYWVWMASAPGFFDLGFLPAVSEPGWFIAAIDDFDGDGLGDVLWRHSVRGENYIWFMDFNRVTPPTAPSALTVARAGHTVPVADQNYQVKGTGDFNGDWKMDLVWRNDATGHTIVWLMDGVSANGAPVPAPGAGWQFITALDFDGDEKQDVLWRNPNTGENAICLMNGFNATCGGIPSVTQAGWNVIAP